MPGTTIGASFGNGFAGTYAQQPDMIIDTHPVKGNSAAIVFGEPALLNSDGTVSRFGATGTATTFVGVASREVKSASSFTDQNAGGQYGPGEAAAIFKRGGISVICNVGTPAPGGTVYVRVTANGSVPAGVVGGFEATADDTKTVALTNCVWGTTKDANGVATLIIKTRNSA